MAKLVDALALGASEATHEGSSPFPGTKNMEVNTFYDINKLPAEKGLILFGLSMNKLQNRQSAEMCIEDIRHLGIRKMSRPLIGLNFIYSDYL